MKTIDGASARHLRNNLCETAGSRRGRSGTVLQQADRDIVKPGRGPQ